MEKSANQRDIYRPQSATLKKVEPMTALEKFFEFQLDSDSPLSHQPGQFVEVGVPGFGEAPISISSSPTDGPTFQLVVRRVGGVTTALHNLSVGDRVGIRGPFGTHFPVEGVMRGKDIIFICGGIGLVPVRSAIRYVLHHRQEYGAVSILVGTRNPSERLFLPELAEWRKREDVTLLETVDQGDATWRGNVGVVTTLIPQVEIKPEQTVAIVCGPPVMYRFVIMSLSEVKITPEQIYLSLERRMKCGVGKCGHCQINGLYTCVDGPVFQYSDVVSIQEAI